MALPPSFRSELVPGLAVEDHGSEFYIISEGQGHDMTFSLEAPVAERLARFILNRRGGAASRAQE